MLAWIRGWVMALKDPLAEALLLTACAVLTSTCLSSGHKQCTLSCQCQGTHLLLATDLGLAVTGTHSPPSPVHKRPYTQLKLTMHTKLGAGSAGEAPQWSKLTSTAMMALAR